MRFKDHLKRLYVRTTGYSYTNLGRLFLRLFVGIMLLQFGVRQTIHFEEMRTFFPAILGMSADASLITMTCIEIGCSIFIMCGLLTRLMTIPPMIAMIVAEGYLLYNAQQATYLLTWQQQGYLPLMFLGIYVFIMLVGPGKISIDYFLSLHILHTDDKSESELEEV